ncbi:response regulator [Terrimonas sp. NA20]|uniref:Response regulator n=1 Tax=Terrimonas ginsenosidimutans TaxID=2908004 RepID=A0ABS9KV92_9BACT|nr:response regulator [Terrimonas ginsenosidimutans]MCG2616267.1 response regulator [Terrimonas ginsenosidimutans]
MTGEKKILIVDDEPEHRFICETLFNSRGYDVFTIPDCSRLVEVIEQYRPRLIIMDHHMPGMNGADAIRMLKAHADHRSIPVIYFSAHNELADLAKEVGADGYIRKPCELADLTGVIERYFPS